MSLLTKSHGPPSMLCADGDLVGGGGAGEHMFLGDMGLCFGGFGVG